MKSFLKKVINATISVSLVYSQTYVGLISIASITSPSIVKAEIIIETNSTINSPENDTEQSTSVESTVVDNQDATTSNAQCVIYFDTLQSADCKRYWQDVGSNSISDLENGGDPQLFESCLNTTCGSYPTAGIPQEQTYPYIMETVKGCTLNSESTVSGEDLSTSQWFRNDTAFTEDEISLSDADASQVKTIPYKLLQYTCPSYIEDVCVKQDRVLQSPVMCFKSGTSESLKTAITNCMTGDNSDACAEVENSGGIAGFVFWQYCDQDSDGDEYYESLSPQTQVACNRSDAASLRCEMNKSCTLTASCTDEENVTKSVETKRQCENVTRHFEEHVINTQCGDQTDQYRENPDCVRINSITDAIQDNTISVGFASGLGEQTNDYTEFVLYKKKENFQHDAILAALFFPWSLDAEQKGWSILGVDVTNIAAFFGARVQWDTSGLDTILDDLYSKTIDYCANSNNSDSGCTVEHENNVKSWSWTTGHIIKKKYTRVITQTAIWTEPFVTNMDVSGFDWAPGPSQELQHIPMRINYMMKAHLNSSDILVIYNTNTVPSSQSYIGTRINTYVDIPACGTSGISPISQYKDILKPVSGVIANNVQVHDVAMVLPHAGVYTFNLYDNDTYVDTFVKYFPMNDGTNYPIDSAQLLATNLDYDSFSDTVLTNIKNKIPDLVDDRIQAHSTLIDDITNQTLNILIEANKYTLDNNSRIDYLDGLENSDASLIYSLLEEDKIETLRQNNALTEPITEEPDLSNFPEKIDPDAIKRFEEVVATDEEDPQSDMDQFAVGRLGTIDTQRSDSAYLSSMQSALTTFLAPLDDNRLNKIVTHTNEVYSDFSEVMDVVDSYLNKAGNRYSTSTSYGGYTASFKSACGDYSDALTNVQNHYDEGKSIVGSLYQADLNNIKGGIQNIITGHLSDQTIRYKYYENTRTGDSKYDNYHSATIGTYSCTYDCNVYSNCATTTDIVCDADGTNCTGGDCVGGYVWTTDGCTESSSCYTFGNTGSRCTGQCNGYHLSHYGSEYDDNGADTNNDWDNICEGDYKWYNTSDNGGVGGSATFSGTTSGHFDSWGSYACDELNLTPTGTDTTKCVYDMHDQVDNYINTVPSSTLSWSSTSKKLNTTTGNVDSELTAWMKNNNYKDSSDVCPYYPGDDNVRYALSYDETDAVNTYTNEEVRPIIRAAVVDLYKDYLTKYYNNLLDNDQTRFDPELTDLVNSEYTTYYEAYFAENWHKFNRIVIKDNEIRPENNNSVNYDITLPGGHYVENPGAFSITISPHDEVRKYRCYTDWENCEVPDNCTFNKDTITNYITDSDAKSVPTLKNIDFICNKDTTISICNSLKVTKECTDLGLISGYIDYDDVDFSQEFFKNIGSTVALNTAITLFGGQEMQCQEGVFADYSWAQDPMFYLGAFSNSVMIAQSTFKTATLAFAESGGPEGIDSSTGVCTQSFVNCLNDAGFTGVDMANELMPDDNASDINATDSSDTTDEEMNQYFINYEQAKDSCVLLTGESADCRMWADEYHEGEQSYMDEVLVNNDAQANAAGESLVVTVSILYGPVAGLVAQAIVNLVFNTFEECSQCTDESCAKSHSPQEAISLLKMDGALKMSTKRTGSKYGLGSDFVAYDNCFFKETGCAKKFVNSCIRSYKNFCCYNSKITRILAGQVYQQLGYRYKEDGCSAIHITDLQRIDFTGCAEGVIPSPTNRCVNYEEMKDYIMSQVNWNTQRSFDTNMAIQTSINAAKMME